MSSTTVGDFIYRECNFDTADLAAISYLETCSHRFCAATESGKPRHGKKPNHYVMMALEAKTGRYAATCSASWKAIWAGGKFRLCGEIYRLRVDPAYRRRGLGRDLSLQMEKELLSRGVELCYVVIWTPNFGSETLFQDVLKYKLVYHSSHRMMTIKRLAAYEEDTSLEVTKIDQPIDEMKTLFGKCMLWPEDVNHLDFVLYRVELPDGKAIQALLWQHCYPLMVKNTPYSERAVVQLRRLGHYLAPAIFEKPIGDSEKFVIRCVYPFFIPEGVSASETQNALNQILRQMAIDSLAETNADYLTVPIHLSQLNDDQLNLLPFANLLPDQAHCFYIKPLGKPDAEFAEKLDEEAKQIIFMNPNEL